MSKFKILTKFPPDPLQNFKPPDCCEKSAQAKHRQNVKYLKPLRWWKGLD